MSAALECGVVEGRFAVGGRETLHQCGIGAELLGSSMKLALVAEHDSGAIGEGMDRPAYIDLLAAQDVQTRLPLCGPGGG